MTVETRRRRRLVFHMAKRPDLQGMRAVAVLAVFADHLFGWPSGGFVGVDIFFVLSGFFITGLLLKERSKTGEVSFQNFYIRRVKRIIPSALLVLAVTRSPLLSAPTNAWSRHPCTRRYMTSSPPNSPVSPPLSSLRGYLP